MTPMSRMSHLMACTISEFPVLLDVHSMAISILSTNNHMPLETKFILKKLLSPIYFWGMTTKHIRQSNGSFKMEYEAELLPPIIPRYPAQPIRIQLSHKMRIHERHQLTLPHHESLWAWFLGKLETLTGIFCQWSPDFPEAVRATLACTVGLTQS